MCAGILPQLRQGLAGFTVGTLSSVGKQRVCPSLLPSLTPSFSVAVVHKAGPPPLVFLTFTVTLPPLFSHPVLFSPHYLFSPFSCSSLPSKNQFSVVFPLTFIIMDTDPIYFLSFSFFLFPSHSHPESPQLSVLILQGFVHGSSVLPSAAPSLLPLNASPAFILKACLEGSWGLLHE